MKHLYFFSILLFLTGYASAQGTKAQNQQLSASNLTTTTSVQKSLFQALKTESVAGYEKLLPSKEQFAFLVPEDKFVEEYSSTAAAEPL